MTPVLRQVLVKPYLSEEMSTGGILVPENAREINNKVHIIAVGAGTAKHPMKLKSGQTGHRVKLWGQEILIDGQLHFLMQDDAIISLEE